MAQQFGQAMNPANPTQGAPVTGPPAAGPPPIPSAAAYYAVLDGQQAGPFDLTKLRENVGSGRINRQTLVWKQGMGQWSAAGDVGELGALFASAPPPIPKNS